MKFKKSFRFIQVLVECVQEMEFYERLMIGRLINQDMNQQLFPPVETLFFDEVSQIHIFIYKSRDFSLCCEGKLSIWRLWTKTSLEKHNFQNYLHFTNYVKTWTWRSAIIHTHTHIHFHSNKNLKHHLMKTNIKNPVMQSRCLFIPFLLLLVQMFQMFQMLEENEFTSVYITYLG